MILDEIHTLVIQGESNTVEFKKSTVQLKPAFQTVCAFLNSKGGTVLIGVNHHGEFIGQAVTDNTQQEIANQLSKIEPFPSSVEVKYQHLTNKDKSTIIIIHVPLGERVPYTYDGRPYYRNQNTTMRMPQIRYSQLIIERNQKSNNTWETLTTDHYTIDDLDHQEIRHTIKTGVETNRIPIDALNESIEDILIRLNLIKEGKLTNAAVILFAKDTLPDYPQCAIKMARFQGTSELNEFTDSQRIYGNAFKLMAIANDFIMRHFPVASFFQPNKWERVDKPILPVLAVREALVNSICHKDYTTRSSATTLAIFDDRLEIWNNGLLPSFLQIEDLKRTHKSYPRNELISQVFYARGYVESWGTGTTKMVTHCITRDIPEPIFREYSGGFSATFWFKKTIGSTRKSTLNNNTLSQRQMEVMKIIQKYKSIKSLEIIEHLKVPSAERTIRKDLNKLMKMGLIRLEGHGKSAKWTLLKL